MECASHACALTAPSVAWGRLRAKHGFARQKRERGSRTPKAVHPYLRYGIMLGNRQHHPLPGRLYRHGAQFDFMISFCGTEPTNDELTLFVKLLKAEVSASKTLEKILYESRRRARDHYTLLHRQLRVQ